MGYFDSIAESAFKDNPEGEGWLYYPNGIFSKGHIVTDETYKNKLFKFHKRVYMILIPLGFIYGLGLDFDNFSIYDLVPVGIILAFVYLRQYFLTRNLPRCNIKLKYKEATGVAARGLSKYYFYSLYIASFCVIGISLSTPLIFDKPYSETLELTLMLLGLGVFGLVMGVYLHKLKKSNK